MKNTLFTLLCFAVIINIASAQKPGKVEVNLSDPFQVDSSEYFLIPVLVDGDNQHTYGKGSGYHPWGSYSDVIFFNYATRQSKKLFSGQLALVETFTPRRYPYNIEKDRDRPANILANHIVYLARTDNYNGDNALDTDDPVYLYISTKTGDQLRQITPKGFHVMSWTVSHDKKMILVKGKNDKNGNKKFGVGDDDVYYRVDLVNDVSSIQCTMVNL